MTAQRHIQVVAGILFDDCDQVLVQQRPGDKEHAGRWEFPGGKLEPGESCLDALIRELHEELNVTVNDADVCLQLAHQYPKVYVDLTIMRVRDWSGDAVAREQQVLQWTVPAALTTLDMLEANGPIIDYLLAA